MGIVVRLVVLCSIALAGCSFDHSYPVSGGGGSDSGVGPISPDAALVSPDAAPDTMPPPCPDDDTDGVCNSDDDWPCGAKPPEPPAMLMWMRNGNATTIKISSVSLDGTGRMATATPGETLSLRLDYAITDTACNSNCVDQLEIGWVPNGARLGCIFDSAVSKTNGATGTVMANVQARTTKQAYDLRIELGQNFSCGYQGATTWWDNQTPGATRTIAKLCVH